MIEGGGDARDRGRGIKDRRWKGKGGGGQ